MEEWDQTKKPYIIFCRSQKCGVTLTFKEEEQAKQWFNSMVLN